MSPKTIRGRGTPHSVHLDFVRGLASLLVVLGHLRAFDFVGAAQLDHPGFPTQFFYFWTGLSTYAVILFFVLSGYLVGGEVIQDAQSGRWAWDLYLIKRLTRLWVVLAPALLLTCLWDLAGIRLHGVETYQGRYFQMLGSGPGGDYDLGLKAFLGNLFFFQGTFTPSYGTDGPLWSLANEFWYYLLFPLLLLGLGRRGKPLARLVHLALAAAIFGVLPFRISLFFGVWLIGAAAFIIVRRAQLNRLFKRVGVFGAFLASLLGLLVLCQAGLVDRAAAGWPAFARNNIGAVLVYLIGITFGGTLPFLVERRSTNVPYMKISKWLSETSYTLYLVHFPLLAFFFFNFRLPAQVEPGLASLLGFFGGLALVLLYARAIWFCFEKRTGDVRRRVLQFRSHRGGKR